MYNDNGSRKYIDSQERLLLIRASRALPIDQQVFLRVIAETGCRISEALNLKLNHLDLNNKSLRFESLKKRRSGIFRSVPVSDALVRKILSHYKINHLEYSTSTRLWPWSRTTAYRLVIHTMHQAGIYGPHATPRGLRHGFAVAALESGIPITLVQRWLGHASLKTTAIYTEVIGREERRIASRMWRRRPVPTSIGHHIYA